MIDIKVPEEEQESKWLELAQKYDEHFLFGKTWEEQRLTFMFDMVLIMAALLDNMQKPKDATIELHEISKTLKEILREMRKRKV